VTRIKRPSLLVFVWVGVSFASVPNLPHAWGETKVQTPNPAPAPSALAELEPVLNRALAAYNADDKNAFLAEFARAAPGIHGEGVYRRLFGSVYKSEFGKIERKRLKRKASVPDRDWGALTYDAAFEKHPKALLVANFIRENGAVKLMQIRFDATDW
jgi:hypothetical protein